MPILKVQDNAVLQVYVRMNMKTTGDLSLPKLSVIDLVGSKKG